MRASTIFLVLIASALIYSCSDRDDGPGGGGGGDAGRRDSGGGGPDSGGGGDDAGSGDDAGGADDGAVGDDAGGGPRDGGRRDSGGGPGTVCGGLGGATCGRTEWCDYPTDAFCGAADGTGTCQPRPEACDEIYMPVCGCNDMTYSNACLAHAAGVDDAAPGMCSSPPPPDGECMSDADCAPAEHCSLCRGAGGAIYVCIPDGAEC